MHSRQKQFRLQTRLAMFQHNTAKVLYRVRSGLTALLLRQNNDENGEQQWGEHCPKNTERKISYFRENEVMFHYQLPHRYVSLSAPTMWVHSFWYPSKIQNSSNIETVITFVLLHVNFCILHIGAKS